MLQTSVKAWRKTKVRIHARRGKGISFPFPNAGKVELIRGSYRRGRSGQPIFPLEIILGIDNGFTLAAADRVGKQFAATGSSQGRTLEAIEDQFGERIGTEKLRKLVGSLAEHLEPLR